MTVMKASDLIKAADVHANRPAVTAVPIGALYCCTTHNLIYRNNGASWDTWATLAGASAVLLSTVTTKGDLIVATASGTVTRRGVGADKTALVADSSQTDGVNWQALDDSYVAPVAPNDQTGTTYTFVLADGRRLVTASNAAAQTYTVPPNSSVAYPLGTVLQVVQKGAGQVTLAAGAGVTLNQAHGLKTSAQWAVVSLQKILTDTWVVAGDTSV